MALTFVLQTQTGVLWQGVATNVTRHPMGHGSLVAVDMDMSSIKIRKPVEVNE